MADKLHSLFLASEEAFFLALENRFSELAARLQDMEGLLDSQRAVIDNLSIRALALTQRGAAPTAWVYHARMPNPIFDDVFEPELEPEGAKRWVGASGRLTGSLLLDRRHQYKFEIDAPNFVTAAAESSFMLTVNGTVWPWLSRTSRLFSTIISEAPHESSLDFSIKIEEGTRPADRDVSFAFRRISVIRLA
jgi:hypothetical protein